MSKYLALIAALCLLATGTAEAQERRLSGAKARTKPRTARIDVAKVPFVRASKVPIKRIAKSVARTGKRRQGKPPAPLAASELSSLVSALQKRAIDFSRRSPVDLPGSVLLFRLDAAATRVDDSWLTIWGDVYPGGTSATGQAPVAFVDRGLALHLHPTTPGASYLLDCSVNQTPVAWRLEGAVDAEVIPTAGHILVGFVATAATTTVGLAPAPSASSDFYGCDVRQLTE